MSIATIYSFFTKVLGFRENCDEGKVEALAANGKPDEKTLSDLNEIIYVSNTQKKIRFETNVENFQNFFEKKKIELLLKNLGRENFSSTVQVWLENIVISFLNQAFNLCGACVSTQRCKLLV